MLKKWSSYFTVIHALIKKSISENVVAIHRSCYSTHVDRRKGGMPLRYIRENLYFTAQGESR